MQSSIASTVSTDTIPRARPAPLPMLLRVVSPLGPTREVRLCDGKVLVGSAAEAGLVLDDPTVSRKHAEFELVPEGVHVRDLQSRNGTFYLGNRIGQITVLAGAWFVVGRTEVHVAADTSALGGSAEGPERYAEMLGRSRLIRQLTATLRKLEGSLVGVLLSGESGTGKELVARAIHAASHLASGPFVAVNCGALNANLAQSELFGHRRGAFTGAVEARRGAFEAAHGGTLFLDEVGELPLEVQPLLLRSLQERCVTRLGENEVRKVDVRLIAATHRDLGRDVVRGKFREDLYYRLKVAHLTVPPLREREGDVELLARHFAQSRGAPELPAEVIAQLRGHHWPGNVRELHHAIDAYLALGELPSFELRPIMELELRLERYLDLEQPYELLKRDFLERFQRSYVQALLAHAGGSVSQAARISGLERSYLGKLVQRYREAASEQRRSGTRPALKGEGEV